MDSCFARIHRDGGGFPVFPRKTGFSEYLRCKYSDSPRPSGTPLINAGGKKFTLIDNLQTPGSSVWMNRGLWDSIQNSYHSATFSGPRDWAIRAWTR